VLNSVSILITVCIFLLTVLVGFAKSAHANTLSAIGGLGFGRNTGMNELRTPPPLLGAEYMLDLSTPFEIGGFYDENFLSYKTGESGSIRALGVQGRVHFLGMRVGPFADAQIGIARRTQGENTSGNKASFGAGVGYEIPLATRFSLSPHVGMRMLPDSISDATNRPVVDGAMMFSVRL
jgi:hypothetical protein